MQKKDRPDQHQASNWEQGLKKQQRAELFKKIALWSGIFAICISALAALVIYADKSTSGTTTVVENQNLPKPSEKDIIVGDKNAEVTITEYADFQCPACAAINPLINRVFEEYKGKANLVFRFFPLRTIHKNALISGQAAYAAHKLGKFGEMKDLLYDHQTEWENLGDPKQVFEGYASSLGLDVNKFRSVMNSDEAKNAVLAGENEAIGLGLNSTPTLFIGIKKFSPAGYEDFKKLIDEELGK